MSLTVISIIVYVVALITTWVLREPLFGNLVLIEPIFLGITAGSILFITFLPGVEKLRGRELRLAWRKRLEEKEGVPGPYPGGRRPMF